MIRKIPTLVSVLLFSLAVYAGEPGSVKGAGSGKVTITNSHGSEVTVYGAIKNGKVYIYDEHDNVSAEYEIDNGKFHGVAKDFYKDGNLRSEGHYQNGMLHGLKKMYTESGRLSSEINYVSNRREGVSRTYSFDGSVIAETLYKDGKPAGIKKYDSKGNLLTDSITGNQLIEEQAENTQYAEEDVDAFVHRHIARDEQKNQIKETKRKRIKHANRLDFYVMLNAPYHTIGHDFDGQHILSNYSETLLVPKIDGNIGYGIGLGLLFVVQERPVDFAIEVLYNSSQHGGSFMGAKYDVAYQTIDYVFKAYFNAKQRTQPFISVAFNMPNIRVKNAAFFNWQAGISDAEFKGLGYSISFGISHCLFNNLLIEGGLGYRNDSYNLAKGVSNEYATIINPLNSNSMLPALRLIYIFR